MSLLTNQLTAEVKVLEYKLNRIKTYALSRKGNDPVVDKELSVILNIIADYEIVPDGWELSEPLVNVKAFDEVKEDNNNGEN